MPLALRSRLRDLGAVLFMGPFRAVRHPDFRRFLTGQGISLVGTWMQSIAQGWLVLELTRSAFAVGLTSTLATLPILFFTLYGGVVADRVDKRRFIMALQAVMLVEAAVLAALTLTNQVTVEWIWALAVLFGLATAFEVPARQAFLVELVPAEDLVSAAAVNSTTYNLARVIGPAIAGIVVAIAGPGAAFALNALSYVAVLVGLSRIRAPHIPKPPSARPSVFTGVRFIRSRPVLAALSWQMVLLTVLSGSFIPILAVYAREVLHVGARGYGALTAAVGVGAVAGAVLIGGVGTRLPRPRAAVIGAATLSVAVVLLAFSREAFLSLVLLALAGAAMATQGIATATSLQLAAPNELRGRVMAVYSFVVLGLAPLGAFQAGWVAEHLGAAWSIGLSGGAALLGTAWLSRRLWDGTEETC
ncbi:MAG: MFS transporter [Gemmatimonadetes bacterium]|nr:MFS transporter [Gemmatimonadota bacterium]MBK9549179.1 MFS transporter [Gemmatimonadota bacterium]MBP9899590.1 MFS transporter [Gemmatimonadales bacterium]